MKCHTFGLQRQSPTPCRTWPGRDSAPGVPPSGGFVQNKPNFGRGRWRQTNPICRREIRSNCAKQSQFPAEGKKWQVLGGERVMVDWPPEPSRQNKANSRPDQGPAVGSQGAGGTNKANWRRWPIVQNEPNFWRGRVGRGPRGMGRDANVQNEPNSAGADCAKQTQLAAGRPRAILQNEANSGTGQEMASAWWKKSYGRLTNRTAPAKQSQFRSDGRLARRTGGTNKPNWRR